MKNSSKIADVLKESLDRKVISMSLDEYENMKGMIDDQKELIQKLKDEKHPVFSFRIVVGTEHSRPFEENLMYSLARAWSLTPDTLYARIEGDKVSDNPVLNKLMEVIDDKLEKARSFEESAIEALTGIRNQRMEYEESLKRAPWWCRWAIKPKTNEKGS